MFRADGVYETTLVLRDARGAERAYDVGTVHTSGAVWSTYEFAGIDHEHPEAMFSLESVETEGAWAVLVLHAGDELRVERRLIVDLDGTTPPAPRRIHLPAGATLTPERD